ncbi:MAG: tRNA (cytidine(34)-2'-O)-methyltransferase [Steroidobacteraceae bacterium]|jgi:tRNA (cytidine/uridine-2'-O-)-methyltransferase
MFHILLFEPRIPPNTGNIIRLCANTGAALHLISPLGFDLDDKKLRRSGLDYHDLAAVRVHAGFDACRAALAGARLLAVETGASRRYTEMRFRAGDALLFGPETGGLPAELLGRIGPDNVLAIPMQTASRSLNLSNAVALVIYEAWRQLDFAGAGGP